MPELAIADAPIVLNVFPHPFRREDDANALIPAGQSLAEIMGDAAWNFRPHLNGELIPRERWETTFPESGAIIDVICQPGKGNTGQIAGMIAMVVVAAAATWVSGGAAAAAFPATLGGLTGGAAIAAGAAIGLVGPLPPRMLVSSQGVGA